MNIKPKDYGFNDWIDVVTKRPGIFLKTLDMLDLAWVLFQPGERHPGSGQEREPAGIPSGDESTSDGTGNEGEPSDCEDLGDGTVACGDEITVEAEYHPPTARNDFEDWLQCGLIGNEGLDINLSFPVIPFVIPVGNFPVPAAIGFTGGIQVERDGYRGYGGPALQVLPGPAVSFQRMTGRPSGGLGYALGGGGLPIPIPLGFSPSGQLNISPAANGRRGSLSAQGGLTFGSTRGAYVAATYTGEKHTARVTSAECR